MEPRVCRKPRQHASTCGIGRQLEGREMNQAACQSPLRRQFGLFVEEKGRTEQWLPHNF